MTAVRKIRPTTMRHVEQVLALCIQGRTIAEMARELKVPPSTIRGWIAGAEQVAAERGITLARRNGQTPPKAPREPVERPAPVPMGPWPVIAEEVRVTFGDKCVATHIGVGEDVLRAWCAGSASPCVKHQAALKRLLATAYARELELDPMDLEDERDELRARGDRMYGKSYMGHRRDSA